MSNKQVQRIVALLLFGGLLYKIQGTLLPIILSLVLFYLLSPLVNLFVKVFPKKFKFGRDLSILVAFLVFIVLLWLVIDLVVPSLVSEFSQLSASFPEMIAQLQLVVKTGQQWYLANRLPAAIDKAVFDGINNTFNFIALFLQQTALSVVGIFAQFIGLIVIPVIVYYMLKDEDNLVSGIVKIVPTDHKVFAQTIIERVSYILKSYIEGQILICSLIGIVTGIGLYFLGIKYYLVLGLIAGVTELIPFIGPFIGAIPAVIIAYLASPAMAVNVTVFYTVAQSLGNYILVPKVMGNKLDLHPLTILLGILILGNLIGVWGILFAAPIIAILKTVYLELKK
ncbi:MAG: AI-2E family transporter [Candidatus Margulisbacteria bacterium]|nr:AI-2E family transporter [Candidatus Margulisiibacteriota bacterium]